MTDDKITRNEAAMAAIAALLAPALGEKPESAGGEDFSPRKAMSPTHGRQFLSRANRVGARSVSRRGRQRAFQAAASRPAIDLLK